MPDQQLKKSLKDPAFRFDTVFEWQAHEGKIVPSLKSGASPKSASLRSSAYLELNALLSEGSPCLRPAAKYDILAEGDSWFCLSIYGAGHVTMIQQLSRLGYAVCNISKYSRSSHEMQERKNSANGYIAKLANKPKIFAVSSGGIDFLGETIINWLDQRSSTDFDPKNAHKYINGEFDLILNCVKYNYLRLVHDVENISPNTTILFQTYAYAAGPVYAKGLFLGQYFTYRGFDPIDPRIKPLNSAIIKLVLDRLYRLLVSIKKKAKVNVEIVDFRTKLTSSDIRDEIHPEPEMAQAMAEEYIPFLKKAGVKPRK
jgi:hypothetical protein